MYDFLLLLRKTEEFGDKTNHWEKAEHWPEMDCFDFNIWFPIFLLEREQTIKPLSANLTKWSNTLKQFACKSRRIIFEFGHFLGLALKGLKVPSPVLRGTEKEQWPEIGCFDFSAYDETCIFIFL